LVAAWLVAAMDMAASPNASGLTMVLIIVFAPWSLGQPGWPDCTVIEREYTISG
jgi:hypothetical protein